MAKYASIDIGSNTLLLLIAEEAGGTLKSIVDACDYGRLGQGMATSDCLHPDAIERSLEIVRGYRKQLDSHEIAGIACVATQAIREARNRDEFVKPAEQILGAPIEIIAGPREADLVAQAVMHSFPQLCQGEVVIVDVGGGSTEFIHLRDQECVSLTSLPIGAVRLSERYLHSDPPTLEQSQTLFAAIDEVLSQLKLPTGVPVIGTAGTSTTIASLELKLTSYQPERIHGLHLPPAAVGHTLDLLMRSSLEEKKALPGLEPQRADVITGGVAIYSRVLRQLQATDFVICDRGVRWGLLYEQRAA